MQVLFLGPPHLELQHFLESCDDSVTTTEEKITSGSEWLSDIDFIVSYRYRHILKQDVLSQFLNRVINIHISLLPWNRGADPNLWSFLEDTPKGVTIHYIDSGIDTGKILVQEVVSFTEHHTLRTSYEKLTQVAEALFKANWLAIRDGKIQPFSQVGEGSYHRTRDRAPYEHLLTQGWDTPVRNLIGKALKHPPTHLPS
ncbi:formyl transferase [Oscillatoria sp. FACHB-1407]|uniref:formyltransferase family protein n=1 Tax=Oscillatoria sp. FACHB-1407 TaxID=2692847 RepID=UPI001685A97A|nr:formyltransferase family protein [Oscillatoria sp. FACHB-1407]MBD2464230.1 formyl transferase [Oscillatoria sp. FACHB-1407]